MGMRSISRFSRRIDAQRPPLTDRTSLAALALAALSIPPLWCFADAWIAEAMTRLDPSVTGFFQSITFLGKSAGYLVGSALLALGFLLWARRPGIAARDRYRAIWRGEAALYVLSVVAAAGIVINIIKPLVGRMRPVKLLSEGQYGIEPGSLDYALRSFPSGHATTVFALAFALGALWPRFRWAFALLALPVAASRVAITAHFMSDVVAGALVGIVTALVLRRIFAHYRIAFRAEGKGYRLPAYAD